MYNDYDYAKKRLESTLVRLKDGKPFWVREVHLNLFEGTTPKKEKEFEKITSKKPSNFFDYEEIPLKKAVSIEIVPTTISTVENSQVQISCSGVVYPNKVEKIVKLDELDLTPVSLGFINLENERKVIWVSRKPVRKYWRQGLGAGNIYIHDFDGKERGFPPLPYMYKTIVNEYPSLEDARDIVGINSNSIVAFHRHFAISKDSLFYKNKEVGNAKNLSFNNRFEYLSEYFYEEVLNGYGSGTF